VSGIDDLIHDLVLIRTIYANVICVESVRDRVIHLRAGSLFDTEFGPKVKVAHVLYDTTRHSIIEIVPEGPGPQSPHKVLIHTCGLPASLRNQYSESVEVIREQAHLLRPETTRVSLYDCVSFLAEFPSFYCRVSKSVLQTQLKPDPGELVRLTLGFMDQVMHFEKE
jgi:hypothetical protein